MNAIDQYLNITLYLHSILITGEDHVTLKNTGVADIFQTTNTEQKN